MNHVRALVVLFSLLAVVILSYVGNSIAQNKVVVIPLIEKEKLQPFAPVTAVSPTHSAYTDNSDGTVTDNITGLVWQKMIDEMRRDWHTAWDYCVTNEENLPGIGWRLPTIDELMSILDYSTHEPSINNSAFPETEPMSYWSATTSADSSGSNSGWYISFYEGTVGDLPKSNPYNVRCVRGLPVRESLFKNNGNGTVTDLTTGLTWQRQDDNEPKGWYQAVRYCQDLALAGSGWRLPNVKELRSIIDTRVAWPAVNADVFPDTEQTWYWTATDVVGRNDFAFAWQVSFANGSVGYYFKSSGAYPVRCVR